MKQKKISFKLTQEQIKYLFLLVALAMPAITFAQVDGVNTGLTKAGTELKGYFTSVSTLILAIGGIVGLVGGIRVYTKWNNGDHEINKEIVGWAGSCVFLLLTGTILRAFFSV